ncbi:MAG: methyltransferase domain-containing protein [Thiogranum sp.]|nr:methyltransferase domain-containing protein [Thiogranum sp.]
MVAFTSTQREHIVEAVQAMYTDVARAPRRGYHFPVGREACLVLGYLAAWLDSIPPTAVESFVGVACPVQDDLFQPAETVLDIGAGSGTDTLIAALRVGEQGQVYSLDITEAMLAKLADNVKALGIHNVQCLCGDVENIPLPDHSVDVIISNGVLNLVYDKPRAFAELWRVLRPGGRISIADISVNKDLEILQEIKGYPRLWAECVAGAISDDDYLRTLESAGFRDLGIIDQLDYFSHSSSDSTRQIARNFGAHSIVLRGHKPT